MTRPGLPLPSAWLLDAKSGMLNRPRSLAYQDSKRSRLSAECPVQILEHLVADAANMRNPIASVTQNSDGSTEFVWDARDLQRPAPVVLQPREGIGDKKGMRFRVGLDDRTAIPYHALNHGRVHILNGIGERQLVCLHPVGLVRGQRICHCNDVVCDKHPSASGHEGDGCSQESCCNSHPKRPRLTVQTNGHVKAPSDHGVSLSDRVNTSSSVRRLRHTRRASGISAGSASTCSSRSAASPKS